MKVIKQLPKLLKKAKLRLLQLHYECKVGHLGGNLSALDTIVSIFYKKSLEDVFVLSKGHAAGALYVALWVLDQLSDEELRSFYADNSKLAGHPKAGWHPEILFSTGSLGHGLGLAAGVALGRKLQKKPGQIYCLLSDGEWEEGSNWEALIFVAHHQLTNLTMLVDCNGIQCFGSIKEVASLEPLAEKIRSFAVNVVEIDGHDMMALDRELDMDSVVPKVIMLNTVKGKGISFMENQMAWHSLALTEGQYQQAAEEMRLVCETQ